MRAMYVIVPLLALLSGCSQSVRAEPLRRDQAQLDTTIRTLVVRYVWDQVDEPLDDAPREVFVSHYMDVDVVDGPDKGSAMTLPFDVRYAGRPVPKVGERLTAAPADFVPRNPVKQLGMPTRP